MLKWFKDRRKARRQLEEDIALAEAAPRLHGINLLEWRYLGRTLVHYSSPETNQIEASATVFGFCGHDDTDQRHFIVIPHSRYGNFDTHTWVMEHAALWQIGERNLWDIVAAEPSKWLREYMLEKFNEVWGYDEKWWVPKGAEPKKKPKLELVKDAGTDNVVKLDFKTKKPETT